MALAGCTNKAIVDQICSSINNTENDAWYKCLVLGGSGWGKTTLCDALVARLGETMDVFEVKHNYQADSEAKMHAVVSNFVFHRTIMSFLAPPKPKLVIIDDIDIHMRSDRGYTSFVTDLIGQKMPTHVVLSCQLLETAKLPLNLKRKLTKDRMLSMMRPTPDECSAFIDRSRAGVFDKNLVRMLSEVHQGNIRHVINDLEAGRGIDDAMSKVLDADDKARSVKSASTDTVDMLTRVFNADPPMSSIEIVHLGNPMLLNMLHENLVFEMHRNRYKASESFYRTLLTTASRDFIDAAIMEASTERALIGVDWDLLDCAMIVKCGRASVSLRELKLRKTYHKPPSTESSHKPSAAFVKRLDSARNNLLPDADDEALCMVLYDDLCVDLSQTIEISDFYLNVMERGTSVDGDTYVVP